MNRLGTFCLGLAAAVLASGSAAAADLTPRYAPVIRPAPVYAAVYNWTGFYLGINGGGGWGRSQWDGIDRFDVSGGLIGGTIGYNWQINQLVIGAEGDLDWSGIRGSTTAVCPLGCTTRNSWLATVRGRRRLRL
jgi:outer membrane immunogenic protein